ncbi:TetR family transcriptional regulator [Stackebrandtia endophytica]|uniref:TetR family transcriptional regulator n=1 Tax=Stackebrandtia endophytica TaxID=1496996 RepID=A0A543B1S4_9ACTN|nr:TetR/AcrR family transcriptional regulator [Stackebrandtia endophytica]TQL78779.1 TetR family transcriptional regulator [Stackebrandtia endophytica]
MPRIVAATIAEHRRIQRKAIMDAARELLAETGRAPSLAEVGKRAGLPRSTVYEYVRSRDDLLAAVVADVFPDWASSIRDAIESAPTPGEKIWAYVASNVAFFAGAEQTIARALGSVVDPAVLRGPMQEFHTALQEPLRRALGDLGEAEPEIVADLIDAMLLSATKEIRARQRQSTRAEQDSVLAPVRRLLGPYLRLPDNPTATASAEG